MLPIDHLERSGNDMAAIATPDTQGGPVSRNLPETPPHSAMRLLLSNGLH